MTSIQKFHFVRDTQSAILQLARLDKPSGSWPAWVDDVEPLLNEAARQWAQQAKQEMGILRAEQVIA